MKRRHLLAATAASLLVVTLGSPSAVARQPLITDPIGDADRQNCHESFVIGLLADIPCAKSLLEPPQSQPSIDIVKADFRTRDEVLIAELHVLDLDHSVIGSGGSGPEDANRYAMALNTGGPAIVLSTERSTDGTIRRAEAYLYWGPSGTYPVPTPPTVLFDDDRNVVELAIPFQAVNDVMLPICSYCAPLARGTVARWPAAQTAVLDTTRVAAGNVSFTNTEYAASDLAETDDTYTIGH